MGIGGISIWQLLIILAIVLVLFGAKRLRNVGGDLGAAIKGFKKSMKEEDKGKEDSAAAQPAKLESKDDDPIEGAVASKSEHKA